MMSIKVGGPIATVQGASLDSRDVIQQDGTVTMTIIIRRRLSSSLQKVPRAIRCAEQHESSPQRRISVALSRQLFPRHEQSLGRIAPGASSQESVEGFRENFGVIRPNGPERSEDVGRTGQEKCTTESLRFVSTSGRITAKSVACSLEDEGEGRELET